MSDERLDKLTKDLNRQITGINAATSRWLESLARNTPSICPGCLKPVAVFGQEETIIEPQMVALWHSVCHEHSEGWGWTKFFDSPPGPSLKACAIELADVFRWEGEKWHEVEPDVWSPPNDASIKLSVLDMGAELICWNDDDDVISFEKGQAYLGARHWLEIASDQEATT